MLKKWKKTILKLLEKLRHYSLFRFRYKIKIKKEDFIKNNIEGYFIEDNLDYITYYTNKVKIKSQVNNDVIVIDRYKNIFLYLYKTKIISCISLLMILILFLFSGLFIREIVFENEKDYNYSIYKDVEEELNSLMGFYYSKKSLNDISDKLRQKYYHYAYIGVRKKGSKIIIDTKKMNEYEKITTDSKKPCDLIATTDGLVVGVFVKNGLTVTSINQVVKKGELLVSGNLNYHKNPSDYSNLVSADGIVLLEYATYKQITIEKNTEFTKYLNEINKSIRISIFNFEIGNNRKEYENSFIVKNEILNFENILLIEEKIEYKIESVKRYLDYNDAYNMALTNLYFEFSSEKVVENEEILFTDLIKYDEDDSNYTFYFLVKMIKNACEKRDYI